MIKTGTKFGSISSMKRKVGNWQKAVGKGQ